MDKQEPSKMSILQLGIPKGSLQDSTIDIFAKAGYKITVSSRSYYPVINDDDIECMLIRAQEMARYVDEGILDAGLTGMDWIRETDANVVEVEELVYGKVGKNPLRWVLAVPENSEIQSIKDLEGKRIATEVVNLTNKFLAEHKVNATVEFSWGATEVKPPKLADAIVEITETGSSIKANHLRIIDVVCTSNTWLIANNETWKDAAKRTKIEKLALLLKSVLSAESRVGLMMNVKRDNIQGIIEMLPALNRPTVSPLIDSDWVALNTVVEEKVVRNIIPQLLERGAEGIIEYALNKVVM
jgi:ATP phosphoribosyltransferase